MLLRDLTDGAAVDQVLLVAEAEVRTRRAGGAFLKLVLADRSGRVPTMVWEGHEALVPHLVPGRAVRVRGEFRLHPKFGAQLDGCTFGPAADGTYDPADLHDGPPRPAAAMERDLRELVATVQHPHLRELLHHVLGPHTDSWAAYREWPAAKRFHQAYRHGLLEHSLTVAQGVSAMSSTFPGIDRDVAVTGALLHDIGKLEAYSNPDDGPLDLTDAGRLEGEIPLGYFRVRRVIEGLPGFPADTAQAVLHIILAHHGSLEHGSPVVPCTREATLVHFVDNLGGRLGSFDRLEKELPAGAAWSSFDRGIGGSAYFGAPRCEDEQAAAVATPAGVAEPASAAPPASASPGAGVFPPGAPSPRAEAAATELAAPVFDVDRTIAADAVAPPTGELDDLTSLAAMEPEPLALELDVA